MKKVLTIVLALVFALSLLTVPSFAAKVDPLVVDFTDPDVAASMVLEDTGVWGPTSVATGSYDEAEEAFKIEFTATLGQWKSLYWEITSHAQMDKDKYGLIGYYYKASGFGELSGPCGMSDGGAGIGDRKIDMNTDEYVWVTWDTSAFAGTRIIPSIYTEGTEVNAGAVFYLKAVVLFPDQAAFESFDLDEYLANKPEASEPESSAPESSAPESSAPESSAPEASTPESSAPESSAPEASKPTESSKPESSKPESSKPSADTGHATIISGAALMLGAAAAVVVFTSKKR